MLNRVLRARPRRQTPFEYYCRIRKPSLGAIMISHFLSAAEQTARFRRTVLLALAVTFLAVVAVRLISLLTQYNEALAAGRARA